MENKKIYLWAEEAPYTAESKEQAQPSVTAFEVEGAKGAVVICPGGGYGGKADHEGAPIARRLNEYGVSAFVLDYRVKPCHRYAPVTDAKRAIRVVRSLGYEQVGILGFSAGGHLTCSAATMYDKGNPDAEDPIERLSSRPDVFIPCYPVVTMVGDTHWGSREALLGDLWEDEATRREFSPELNVTEDTPPAFIWHTWRDNAVPVTNSLNLASALTAKGVPVTMHIYENGWHGLGLADDMKDVGTWSHLCGLWLVERGFGKE